MIIQLTSKTVIVKGITSLKNKGYKNLQRELKENLIY